MRHQKSEEKTNMINIPGFGPIRLPAHDHETLPKREAINNQASKIDKIYSLKSILNKLLRNK